jgi:hypothetical protein
MRKTTVYVSVKLELEVEQDVAMDYVVNNLDYEFSFDGGEAKIMSSEIDEFYEVHDPVQCGCKYLGNDMWSCGHIDNLGSC